VTEAVACENCGRSEAEVGEIAEAIQFGGKKVCAGCMNGAGASTPEVRPVVEAEAELQPRSFEVLSAREICQLPDPPASNQLLGSLLSRGDRLGLGAPTGAGKTTMGLWIVRGIVLAEPFLDWEGAGGCRALVVDAEQGLKTIKRRLREVGLEDCDEVDYLRVPGGLSLEDDREAAALEDRLASGYDVVLADPLYKLHRGISNEERAAVDLMRRFDGWRVQFGFGLILPTHVRKRQPGSTSFSIDDLFGSAGFQWGAEVVLGLQRISNGRSKLHFFKDRDGDLPVGEKWGLLFDREEGFRRDPDDGKPRETAADKVGAALEAEPDLTTEKLVTLTGYAERTVRDALGKIGATDDGRSPKRWRLPTGQQGELL
jgi:hypothetical protein